MKYINADTVLPSDLLKEVQKYIQGGIVYIPTPDSSRKRWGENSGSRSYLKLRNEEIRKKFSEGISIEQLSEQFFLSFESIKKIVYSKNKTDK